MNKDYCFFTGLLSVQPLKLQRTQKTLVTAVFHRVSVADATSVFSARSSRWAPLSRSDFPNKAGRKFEETASRSQPVPLTSGGVWRVTLSQPVPQVAAGFDRTPVSGGEGHTERGASRAPPGRVTHPPALLCPLPPAGADLSRGRPARRLCVCVCVFVFETGVNGPSVRALLKGVGWGNMSSPQGTARLWASPRPKQWGTIAASLWLLSLESEEERGPSSLLSWFLTNRRWIWALLGDSR